MLNEFPLQSASHSLLESPDNTEGSKVTRQTPGCVQCPRQPRAENKKRERTHSAARQKEPDLLPREQTNQPSIQPTLTRIRGLVLGHGHGQEAQALQTMSRSKRESEKKIGLCYTSPLKLGLTRVQQHFTIIYFPFEGARRL